MSRVVPHRLELVLSLTTARILKVVGAVTAKIGLEGVCAGGGRDGALLLAGAAGAEAGLPGGGGPGDR